MSLNSNVKSAEHNANGAAIKGTIKGKQPDNRSFASLLGHMASPTSVTTVSPVVSPVQAMNPRPRASGQRAVISPRERAAAHAGGNPMTRDAEVAGEGEPLGINTALVRQRIEYGPSIAAYYAAKTKRGVFGTYDDTRLIGTQHWKRKQ